MHRAWALKLVPQADGVADLRAIFHPLLFSALSAREALPLVGVGFDRRAAPDEATAEPTANLCEPLSLREQAAMISRPLVAVMLVLGCSSFSDEAEIGCPQRPRRSCGISAAAVKVSYYFRLFYRSQPLSKNRGPSKMNPRH